MNWYPKRRFVLCYEDGDTGNKADPPVNDPEKGKAGTTFSQEQVNKFVAEEKRSWQTKYEKLEASLNALNEDRSLTEQEKEKLAKDVEDLRKSLRTKETQAEVDRKKAEEKYKSELEASKAAAKKWENMFRKSTVERSLLDAAVAGDAYEPSQIVTILQPWTEMKEENGQHKVMIDFPDVDEKTGEPIETLRTPADAVKRMTELKKYQNLFNSGVVSGIGGSNAGGTEGDIDVASLTPEQYRKIRREHPERLGLPANRRRASK